MKRKEVREDLIQQLSAKKANTKYFEDMVNDYMRLWDTKQKLAADIRKRGVVYTDKSSVGVEMLKNNPSVKELVNVNRQMLSILGTLSLTTENVLREQPGDDADADLG